ncbi:MAG: hypothetical protein KI793_31140 [Rivularia sp. (in: Bacteria)]|nr:hypothetical protein [Rivularia sp. MS3]
MLTGIESKVAGGGQLVFVIFSHSDCGAGQVLSPPKLSHSSDLLSGILPYIWKFSQNVFSPPWKRNCIILPMAGTIITSTWELLKI